MSDLWDYDDDDDQDNGVTWEVPSSGKVDVQVNGTGRKRKGGRNHANGSKRRAVLPAANLGVLPAPLQTTILLDDTDDDDDLVLMTSPVVNTDPGGVGPTSRAPQNLAPSAAPVTTSAIENLNPATQDSLAKEQELLHALQQVTEWENQLDDDREPSPMPIVSRLPGLGLSHLTSRLPFAGNLHRTAVAVDVSDLSDDEVVAADVSAHDDRSIQELAGLRPGIARTSSTMEKEPPTEERVQLKLIWGRDKDECIKMRVVKTEPFEKMIQKFRAIAKERSLCGDPNRIKFLFDGDDLAKMSTETPTSLDMEDDMIIDVRL